MAKVVVTHVPERERYEATLDGRLAGFLEYRPAKNLVVLSHTEVDPDFEGNGVGSALARAALDDIRGRQLTILPLCPFVKSWIGRHCEYADLIYDGPHNE